jgi:anti-anti-sigma factor
VTDHQYVAAFVPVMLPLAGSIVIETRDGASVLRLIGEVDLETVVAHEREHRPVPVTGVDLTDVSFLSSTAVSFLMRRTQSLRNQGRLPVLLGASVQARRVLELTGAMGLFTPAS